MEIATRRELPAILKRFGEWAVTPEGIECLTLQYSITKDSFDEPDWIDHLAQKTWVNKDDLRKALVAGQDFIKQGIIVLDAPDE